MEPSVIHQLVHFCNCFDPFSLGLDIRVPPAGSIHLRRDTDRRRDFRQRVPYSFGLFIIAPTSAMRVKTPAAGFCTFSALLESECFSSFLQNHTQTNASSRHHFPICRPRHSDDSFPGSPTARSACRAITRGSGGEQPSHIYSIPTSAMRVKAPPRGFVPSAPCWKSECSFLLFSKTTPKSALRAATIFRSAGRAILTILFPALPLRGRLAARSRAAVAASIRPINFIFQRQGWPSAVWATSFVCPFRARRTCPTSCWESDLLLPKFKPVCQLLPGFDRPAGHLGQVFHLPFK
jgi:hypothetical protein